MLSVTGRPCIKFQKNRDGGIRTHGPFVPNEVRYQAALHPVLLS